jgi:hypothetical protein
LHAAARWVSALPMTLPMLGPGIEQARKNERCDRSQKPDTDFT